ncbi:hypothetical protein [Xanthomonas phage RTH11]|nr:hypothetical protein [Xanthomonas phage RTH11]
MSKLQHIQLATNLAGQHTVTFLASAEYQANVAMLEDTLTKGEAESKQLINESRTSRKRLLRRLKNLRKTIEAFGPFGKGKEDRIAADALKKIYNDFLEDVNETDADLTAAVETFNALYKAN